MPASLSGPVIRVRVPAPPYSEAHRRSKTSLASLTWPLCPTQGRTLSSKGLCQSHNLKLPLFYSPFMVYSTRWHDHLLICPSGLHSNAIPRMRRYPKAQRARSSCPALLSGCCFTQRSLCSGNSSLAVDFSPSRRKHPRPYSSRHTRSEPFHLIPRTSFVLSPSNSRRQGLRVSLMDIQFLDHTALDIVLGV
ncbi:hypothetical protein FKP32DRAFT_1598513 [Trametes sanguinea]|nr:hypothetical protein FKP32DRAFT_1598513 [Trametes sanguinea]